jgi:hypothetical protein
MKLQIPHKVLLFYLIVPVRVHDYMAGREEVDVEEPIHFEAPTSPPGS